MSISNQQNTKKASLIEIQNGIERILIPSSTKETCEAIKKRLDPDRFVGQQFVVREFIPDQTTCEHNRIAKGFPWVYNVQGFKRTKQCQICEKIENLN